MRTHADPSTPATASAPAHPVQFKGSAFAHALFRLMGWRVVFNGLPRLQGVIVVYPHTSNWDFPIGIVAKWALGIPLHFWGKDSLFKIPVFGRWLRWVGGLPVDRSAAHGAVAQMVHTFKTHEKNGQLLWLTIAPEGTRKHTPGWRSGFYQVALGAQVPVAVVHMNWKLRELRFHDFITLTGDEATDYAAFAASCEGVGGFHPAQASPVVPWRPGRKRS